MSLHPQPIPPIPEETVRVVQAAFAKGNLYLTLRDTLGTLYKDEDFGELYSQRGQPAQSPWHLLSVLYEFRARLVEHGKAEQLLNQLLQQVQAQGLLKARGQQRTDSTHVLAAIRQMNRYECVGETLRHALNVLATVAPQWVLSAVDADWFERYGVRIELARLKVKEQDGWMLKVGVDGHHLLAQIDRVETPDWLRQIPAVETLRQVWIQQFYLEGEQLSVRSTKDMPANHLSIESPYNVEAQNRTKRTTN